MEKEILALFDAWNSALQTRDPKNVVALYETNAILLPTVSNKVRHTHDEIEDYFVHFVAKAQLVKSTKLTSELSVTSLSTLVFIHLLSKMALLFKQDSLTYIAGMVKTGRSSSTTLLLCRKNNYLLEFSY